MRLAEALQCHPMEITEGPAGETPLERTLLEKFRRMSESTKATYLSLAEPLLKPPTERK